MNSIPEVLLDAQLRQAGKIVPSRLYAWEKGGGWSNLSLPPGDFSGVLAPVYAASWLRNFGGERLGGMNAAVIAMERCASGRGCVAGGALVRGGGYCSRCEELAVQLEKKRLAAEERTRGRAWNPVACEASDFPSILAGMSLRERVELVALSLAVLTLGAGAGFLVVLGAKQALGWILSRGL